MDEESRRAVEAARGLLSQGRVVEALKVVLALLRRMGKNDAADALAARQQQQAGAQQQQTQQQQPLSAADLARLLEQVSLERTAAPQAQAPVDGTDGAPSLLSERGQGGIAAGEHLLTVALEGAVGDGLKKIQRIDVPVSLPPAADLQFSDFDQTHPNADAIYYLRAHGIVQGYADNSFRPTATINRAEFTKIIVGALLEPGDADCGAYWGSDDGMGSPFSDVRGSDWFSNHVCRAYMEGLVAGYPDGTFRPAASINFAEAAKILANGFELPFESTDEWYEGYVRGLERKNAIPQSITRFDQRITRGEMAEMIYRLETGAKGDVNRTYEDIERGSKTFDGCGKVSSYANKPWYADFAAQSEKNGFDMEYYAGYSEGCLALDGSLFLAIWSGGYCEGSRFIVYTPGMKNFDTAGIQWKTEGACGHEISEFGAREGSVIKLTGSSGDAGCGAWFYYDYDLVSNVIVKTAMKSQCSDDPKPMWTYYE